MKLKTSPRETKPYQDYLSAVYDMNKQSKDAKVAKRMPSVGSLPTLDAAAKSPPPLGSSSSPTNNNLHLGRHSQPSKPVGGMVDDESSRHQLQLSMGNRNLQYAKKKRVAAAGAE